MPNQMEKEMEHELETGIVWGLTKREPQILSNVET